MTVHDEEWRKSWPAPAKLNLFLHVIGQRADGYHLLQTAFQFIDICDQLVFTQRSDDRVTRSKGLAGLPEENDLVVRAAALLCEAAGVVRGVDIQVSKNIPVGGGLGGGSSDAATTLLVLNRLWQLGLSIESLQLLGLELGADVPVFVGGRAAWAEGVGDRLMPMDFPEPFFLVLDPGCEVSTPEVFRDPELTRNSPPVTIPGFLSAGGRNDCTAVVRRRYPEVAKALDWLSEFGEARLTGTGGCMFLACQNAREASEIRRQVPGPWTGIAVRGRNCSPVHELIEQPY